MVKRDRKESPGTGEPAFTRMEGEPLKASGDHVPNKGEGVGALTHQLPSGAVSVI